MFSSSVYFGKQKSQWHCDSVRLKAMGMKDKCRTELQIPHEIHANISISKQRSLKLNKIVRYEVFITVCNQVLASGFGNV
jgi:hypothetical protein